MNRPATPARVAALFAAVAMTTLLVASQFGLAGHYGAQAGAVLAQQQQAVPVAQVASAGQRLPG